MRSEWRMGFATRRRAPATATVPPSRIPCQTRRDRYAFRPTSHPMTDTHIFRADALTAAVRAVVPPPARPSGEAAQVADEPRRGQPARPRLARRRHDAALRRRGARRRPRASMPTSRIRAGQRPAAHARRLPGLRPGDRRRSDGARRRAGEASTASASSAWRIRTTSAASATGPSSASPHGLVSIHFVNVLSRPIVAPFGGRDARIGTNPFCVGIPRPGKEPIVLDFATSKIAQGKTRVAYNKGVDARAGHDHRRPRRADDEPALHRDRADRRAAAVRRAQGRRAWR